MKPRYITVHNTGNTAKGANAAAHARLLAYGNPRQASWHFTVDDKGWVQHLPTNEVGWHAGDGRGPGNMSSIGIEICENKDGDFAKAEANAAKLVRRLCDELDIPISRVVPHRHWSGKNCPHRTLKHWSQFIQMVKGAKEGKWDGKSFPGRSAFQVGKKHPAVVTLDKRLIAHGFVKHYTGSRYEPGPTFTKYTLENVRDFQKAQGWSGSDADGFPGPVTWKRLMKKTTKEKEKKKTASKKAVKYRVVAGSFADRDNAEAQVKKLKDKGFDAFLLPIE
ncbi:N-acetylmuramoyl-L-alanine amidase [Salinithrix halophila]|uniref:N-acetylmuramoyl-L-alanine amidase n=2 Tax=Salinithrix halophila TaxID=1485204 RepID=A0ABV8J8U3_9BACL